MFQKTSRNHSRINPLRLLAGLLAAGLSVSAFAQSVQFPTYTPGENLSGSRGPNYPSTLPNPWVVSDGTIITPAGTQVNLGTTTRAKAIALNPTGNHTAAVLQMGAPQAVTVFNTQTGAVLQNVEVRHLCHRQRDRHRRYAGWPAPAVQPGYSGFVAYVNVNSTTGLVTTDVARISLPLNATDVNFPAFGAAEPVLNTVNCTQTVTLPGTNVPISGPIGTSGSFAIPCGVPISGTSSYPLGLAVSPE